MRFITAALTTMFLLSLVARAEAKAWRGIVPLVSNRTTVVQALGDGTDPKDRGAKYSFQNEDVSIVYSNDHNSNECVGRLPADLVLQILVIPKLPITIESLGLNQKRLRSLGPSQEAPLRSGALVDDDEGVIVSMDKDAVEQIVYVPANKDRELCRAYYGDLSRFVRETFICILCPTIAVDCPEETEAGNKVSFTVHVVVGSPPPELAFNWTVNEGTILEGQGTASISVDSNRLGGKTMTATVEVSGIDPSCPRTASCGTKILKRPKEQP